MDGCCYIFLGTTRIRGVQGKWVEARKWQQSAMILLEAYIYGHAAQSSTHARLCPCTYTRSCCGRLHSKALNILLFTPYPGQEQDDSPRDHLSVSASVDDVIHKLS